MTFFLKNFFVPKKKPRKGREVYGFFPQEIAFFAHACYNVGRKKFCFADPWEKS